MPKSYLFLSLSLTVARFVLPKLLFILISIRNEKIEMKRKQVMLYFVFIMMASAQCISMLLKLCSKLYKKRNSSKIRSCDFVQWINFDFIFNDFYMLNARVLLLRWFSSFICKRLFTNYISFLYCLQTIRIPLTYNMSCSLICRWFFTCLVRHKLLIVQSTLKTFFFFTYLALDFRSFFFLLLQSVIFFNAPSM